MQLGITFYIIFILTSFCTTKISNEPIITIPKALKNGFNLPTLNNNRTGRLLPSPKVYRCGDLGKEKVLNFVNKRYPDYDNDAGDCSFRLAIQSHDICQIRVDLVDTAFLPPTRGECLSQSLTVQGSVWLTGLAPICGVNNDHHFYLHLEPWTGETSLIDFKVLSVVQGKPYRFGIWVTQMDCSSASNVLKAPEGCTQFYLSETGTIKSFNFEGLRYLNGQNYRICIRSGRGVCGIRYDSATGDFRLRKNAPKDKLLRSGTGTAACRSNFVMIPDGRGMVVSSSSSRQKRLLFRGRWPGVKVRKQKPPPPTVTKRKLQIQTSQDRFCGGTFSPNGGQMLNKPVFARVRSNLISLRIKTSPSPAQEVNRQQDEGKNLTTGFHITYSQTRDCDSEEENEIDMVTVITQTSSSSNNYNFKFFATAVPPRRAYGVHRGELDDGDDSIWEYLDSEDEDGNEYFD